MLGIGVDCIGAPEEPVAGIAGRTLRQFHDVPVEFYVADAGRCPASVLEQAYFTGAEGGFGILAVGHCHIEVLVELLLEFEALQGLG